MTNSWNGQLEGCSISSSKLKESFFFLEYLQKMKKKILKKYAYGVSFRWVHPFWTVKILIGSWLVIKRRIIEARIIFLFWIMQVHSMNCEFSLKKILIPHQIQYIFWKKCLTLYIICIMYIRYSRHEDTYILKEMK